MLALNNLLPSSTVYVTSPIEIKIKIFSFLPIKNLAILRLVSSIWKTFIDTHFTQLSSYQFIYILQKYAIANSIEKIYLTQYAITKIGENNFEKALNLVINLEDLFGLDEPLRDLVKNANTKERMLKLFDIFKKREEDIGPYYFSNLILPLLERYFSLHSSSKKEQEVGNFNEALSILKKFWTYDDIRLLIGLYVCDLYPEQVKIQQDVVIQSLNIEVKCLNYLYTQSIIEKFSFSTFLNFLILVKFFPGEYGVAPAILKRIRNREDALTFLRLGGREAQQFIEQKQLFEHLNFFDLLHVATQLHDEFDPYKLFRKILERAESSGEFEIGLKKLFERKPVEREKGYFQSVVSEILKETPNEFLSFEVYELLLDYPENILFAKGLLRIASLMDITHRMIIVDKVKGMPELHDDVLTELMALEIEMGRFNEAKDTFCSIRIPKAKAKAAEKLVFFIEKEDWNSFDTFFEELLTIKHDLENWSRIFDDLLKQIAKKDVNRALSLAKNYWEGNQLAYFLFKIAEVQKKQKKDFLPLVYEARTLVISLLNPQEDAIHALILLKDLLELQSNT